MTTMSQLRKAALALPETEEGTRSDRVVFSVRGKEFASATKDGWVRLCLPEPEIEKAEAAHSSGERLTRAGATTGFGVPLADLNGKDLNALVRAAWSCRAPRRSAEALSAVDAGVRPADCDLPSAIGGPATRALLGVGLTTLAQVSGRTRKELLDLHGVGPRAVRVLAESLEREGMSLRDDVS
ncbi:hypothetical protein [Nocardiopsis sp. ATB16-24]|uniref:hypothetical protein n=1 Tax=Nocardiopsis sp. ATB16-24 TaxID=3019555 RepID=UPI002554E48C|nr:hypothetical protein [Nocardiopsis sp. ATB16-24]